MKLSSYLVISEPIGNGKYHIVYSTRTTKTLLLTTRIVELLLKGQFEFIDDKIKDKLVECELLISKIENELQTIISKSDAASSKQNSLYYVLQPTANCQLGCDYCGQVHTKKGLDRKLHSKALKRIESKLIKNPSYKSLEIGWFGSEPLMAYAQIQELTPHLKELAKKYQCTYSAKMVTNGLSLKVNVFKILVDLGVNEFEITLDGTAEYHDQRRDTKDGGATFDIIFENIKTILNLPDYKDTGANISIRCNVDSSNHQGVYDLIDMIADHNLHNKISNFYLAPIHSWGNDAHKISLEKEVFAKHEIDWFLYAMNRGFVKGVVPTKTKPIVCMALEKDSELIDASGNIYNCTEVSYVPAYDDSSYIMGNLNFSEETYTKERPLSNWNDDILNNKFPCSSCRILPICGGACPKQWYEGTSPCPSIKFNIEERLLIHARQSMQNESGY